MGKGTSELGGNIERYDDREPRIEMPVCVLQMVIKIASTSSVDKSVHEQRFTYFLSYERASEEQIAYFVGIEPRHVGTTIYGVEVFSGT